MNYGSDKFCLPHQRLTSGGETCMATASDVSGYFASGFAINPAQLRMSPCTTGVTVNNSIGSYHSERMMKQAVPVANNSAMFAGEEGDGSGGRWPRQETLTLLEVRARLNTRFRQTAQKAPLWDEVSRIMAEEYGYNRSGKKCKEKLENLYKYYKKTKQGKIGKHDGRHYRFFRQLDALYGEQGNEDLPITTQTKGGSKILFSGQNHGMHKARTATLNSLQSPSICEGLEFSWSIATDLDCSSSEEEIQDDEDLCLQDRRNREESSLRELVEMQIRRLVEMQETWLDKILKRIEQLENARVSREEEWRRQEATRFELDQHMWNTEQARIKARDDNFIQTLERISRDREGIKFSESRKCNVIEHT
ncbi:Trihelix transcription factor PTL [Rhynchospora pubera]|uniref:Trihelix transcription factor PTL n=1 Tax=Rhynchospora pubera TaxID=906938 RepID=A0AAV8CVK6_9POAL|nr:Trihelix transcription factor PTL [Rhynchospora pubera]